MFSNQLTEALVSESVDYLIEKEIGGKLNVFKVPLAKAREWAAASMKKSSGKDLDTELPNFDKNYMALQAKKGVAKNIIRDDMPVIEKGDIPKFQKDLAAGHVDIFKPFAKGAKKPYFPGYKMKAGERGEWLTLGFMDGDKKDDIVKAKIIQYPASKMKPTQNQIWLEKLISIGGKWRGAQGSGSFATKATIIVSRDGYILDGHHRFAQVMIADPKTTMKALVVPMNLKELLVMGRSYGAALGNSPKA